MKNLSAESEMERTQKWTLLARRIVHDIQSPLGAIMLLVQRIRKRLNSNGGEHTDILAHLDKIEGRIDSLRVKTRNLLKFANLEELHFTKINLNIFVEMVMSKIRLGLPLDTTLHLDLTSKAPSLFVDQEQLQSVIENLCGNAIDSMPNGGALSISTRLAYQLQVHNANEDAKDYAIIEIKDTGSGIPDNVRDRLFEPNFSYSKKSSGLGLAITKKIIDDHGGYIEVESEEELGSIFTVYLPLLKPVEKTQHDAANVDKGEPDHV
jgi:signal transduction histidine kinase